MILGLTKKILVIDVESSSPVDIKKQGQHIYWDDPETRVLMIGYKWLMQSAGWGSLTPMTAAAEVVDLEQAPHFGDVPDWLIDAINAPKEEVMLAAANAPFDQDALRTLGLDTPDDKWIDVLTMAYILGFSGRLNDVLKQTPLGIEKNPAGTRCITEFCVKRTPWYENPTAWGDFLGYCRDDADVEERLLRWCLKWLDTPGMAPIVREVHRQDLIYRRINRRGIPVDRDAVNGALAIVEQEHERLMGTLREATGLQNPNSVAQLLAWCREQGSKVEDLQKATVHGELQDLPGGNLRTALECRAELGKTSVKKFAALERRTGQGDRLRGGWQFYGASRTGRVAGRALNPANLARPQIEDPETAVEFVALGDAGLLGELFPEKPVLDTLSSCIRASLKAPAGKRWCVADLTSIESIGAAWMAGCDKILDIFFAGKDTYRAFASEAERIDYDAVTKKQRTFYKPCLAGDTLVLTLRGWVPIVYITLRDKLWDGQDWVTHEGLAFKGVREVLTRGGVTATPDHLFLEGDQWVQFKDLERDFFTKDNALVYGASSSTWSDRRANTCASAKAAARGRLSPPGTSPVAKPAGAFHASTKGSAKRLQRLLGSVSRATIGSDCRTGFTHCADGASAPRISAISAMAGGAYAVSSTARNPLFASLQRFRDGITRVSKSIGSIMMGTTSPATFALSTDAGMHRTRESTRVSSTSGELIPLRTFIGNSPRGTSTSVPLCDKPAKARPPSKSSRGRRAAMAPTFDVVNAGPRRRFTVKTAHGTAVAHNCVLGATYMLSGKGLVIYGEGYGVDLERAEADRQIAVFRDTYHEIKQHWYNLKDAAVDAVLNPGIRYPVFAADRVLEEQTDERTGRIYRAYAYKKNPKVTYMYDGTFLFCVLPSGRRLCYYKPEVERDHQVYRENGEPWFKTDSLSYMGVNQKGRGSQWQRIFTHGGKLLENNNQGLCRDIMWYGLERAEADPWLEVIGDVYDELLCLAPAEDTGALDRLITCMTTRPPWADERFFLGADGYVAERYRKD